VHLLFLLLACADDPKEGGLVMPDLDDGWNEIDPGGDTRCARGTDFSFFVRPGTTNKLVVEFIGGGACWNAETCGYAGALFADDMDWMRDLMDEPEYPGIYDHENADNPVNDWYHVLVPYCTGDIHWGDSTTTYGEGADEVTIEHKGAVNAQAVLEWVGENFSAPEDVLMTGCSAGAYGSIMWTPHVVQRYPDARVVQLGDSGAGVITEDFFRDSFPSWNPDTAFPSWIPELDPAQVDYYGLGLPDLYARIGAYYPQISLAQFNTVLDWNQSLYFEAMGGGDEYDWSDAMRESVALTESMTPNFRHFMADGDQHCVIPDPSFFTMSADGVMLVDWLDQRIAGEAVDSVLCESCE